MKSLYRTVVVLLATSLLAVPASRAFNTGDIVVDNTRGEARLSQAGKERDVRRGQVVLVPATLRTGRDGAVDLRQGATTVNVGPETVLEFPAAQGRGEPVERIVQSGGNAFYDVGKREGRKLRVETPYLVAVIKGTQFSVSVQEDSTSISLVEGSLEIISSDSGATVDLEAGEVAIRRRGEAGITVVDIDAAQVRVPGAGGADAAVAADNGRGVTGAAADVIVDGARTGNGVEVSTGVDVGVGQVASVELATAVDVRSDGVSVEAGTTVDVGAAGVDVAAGADVAAGVDVGGGGIGATVDVDAGLSAGPLDAGVNAGADLGLGAGGATVDAGLGTAVDVGPVGSEVDVGLTADLDTSPSADVAVDAGVAGVDAGVSAGVDLGTGSVDLGVDVGGLDIDVGLDLGLGDDATDPTTGGAGNDTQGGGLVENVGGLLDGLLRRPRR